MKNKYLGPLSLLLGVAGLYNASYAQNATSGHHSYSCNMTSQEAILLLEKEKGAVHQLPISDGYVGFPAHGQSARDDSIRSARFPSNATIVGSVCDATPEPDSSGKRAPGMKWLWNNDDRSDGTTATCRWTNENQRCFPHNFIGLNRWTEWTFPDGTKQVEVYWRVRNLGEAARRPGGQYKVRLWVLYKLP